MPLCLPASTTGLRLTHRPPRWTPRQQGQSSESVLDTARTGPDKILPRPEPTPQKGPMTTRYKNRSASPRSRFGISDGSCGQMANLPCAATDLAGGTRGPNAKPPKGRLLNMGLLDCYDAKPVSFSGAPGTCIFNRLVRGGHAGPPLPTEDCQHRPPERRTLSHASSKRHSRCERING